MNILAFVDLHSDMKALKKIVKKAEKADIVVCGGDLTTFEHNLNSILKKLDSIGKPVLIIHGNHESRDDLKTQIEKSNNLIYFDKKHFLFNDLFFIGYGDSGFARRDPTFVKVTKKFLKYKKKNHKFILVTHGPPYGTSLDRLYDGEHVGNMDITKFIHDKQPDLVITGHMHENFHKTQKMGKTRIINPGPEGKYLRANLFY